MDRKMITPCVSVLVGRTSATVYVYGREDRTYYFGAGLSFRSIVEDVKERYVNAGPLMPEPCAKKLAHLIYRGLEKEI